MQAAIDRVMKTYAIVVNLTPEQERHARENVVRFLEGKGFDEHTLTIEGLKYLRGCPAGAAIERIQFRTASSSSSGR